MSTPPPLDTESVLQFWLGADFPAPAAVDAGVKRWFGKDDAVDDAIRTRYGAVIDAAIEGDHDASVATPRDWLALLIVLDQFPRNAFRGTARAFAGDPRALALAKNGIARGDDQSLHPFTRLFCYLPLEHSENLADQQQSVALFRALVETAEDDGQRSTLSGWLDYAIRHRDVIARYGRFPHRNAMLQRRSSDAELGYLDQPGSGF